MTTLMDALETAVESAGMLRTYRANEVPKAPAVPKVPYLVFSAQLGRGDGYSLDGDAGLRAVRVVGQAFGGSVEAVNDYTELFIGALAGVELTFEGHRTTQLRVELDPTPPVSDPDLPGVLGSTVTLTAFATEETA